MTRVPLSRALLLVVVVSTGANLGPRGDVAAQTRNGPKVPPLELPQYPLPRPNEVVRKAYQFAVDHPEVLQYVPCFCGCDQMGHKSNVDCFVKSRAKNGDVTAWEEHGMVCAMCLAVCEQSMNMYAAGASVSAIRTEVERKFSGITAFVTPTPPPPPAR